MKKYLQILGCSVLVLFAAGCDNWLDVKPETEVDEYHMFNTEQGFMDALYGVYVNLGKSDIYGGNLQTALDMTAQAYNFYSEAECPYSKFSVFDYENPSCATVIDQLWMRLYYCIGLTNNLLKFLDTPEGMNICANHNYLKGEALALRAYIHFELVRMFAPDVKKNPNYVSIPYRKTFSPDIEPQLKVTDVYQAILNDLNEAKTLLEEDIIRMATPDWLGAMENEEDSDNVTDQNDTYYVSKFLENRKYRMNYYAVIATLARVHITLGSPEDIEKAYVYAKEVINSEKFRPIQEEHILVASDQAKYRDILFTDEIVFGLYSSSVDNFYKNNFDESYDNKKMTVKNLAAVYGSGNRDIRRTHWFTTKWGTSYLLKHQNDLTYSKDKIRMITLPEMYFIAAEAHPAEAYDLLEEILPSRQIHSNLPSSATRTEVLVELLREYRKEYMGDGQFFFQCKRLMDEKTVLSTLDIRITDEDKVLVWPLPLDEIKYGDRESEIWKSEKNNL